MSKPCNLGPMKTRLARIAALIGVYAIIGCILLPILWIVLTSLKTPRDVYTLQWSSMLILVYLAEGLVRATSDAVHTSVLLAWAEVALTCVYFLCALLYLHPFKKAAKEIARRSRRRPSKRSVPGFAPCARLGAWHCLSPPRCP